MNEESTIRKNGRPNNCTISKEDNTLLVDASKWENCTISFPSSRRSGGEASSHPFWVVASPPAGEAYLKTIVPVMTGSPSAHKEYWASAANLRRCRGKGETITCTCMHPKLAVKPDPSDPFQSNYFQPSIIFLIRHPGYGMHGYRELMHQIKNPGHLPEDAWRGLRDEWFETFFGQWEKYFTTWKKDLPYRIGVYLQYEKLNNPRTGPAQLGRLSRCFEAVNITAAPDQDLGCIWYQSIGKTRTVSSSTKNDYLGGQGPYIPGFTIQQQAFLIREFQRIIDEYAESDAELVSIVREYLAHTMCDIRIDRAWNATD